jgi:hypothetical protein
MNYAKMGVHYFNFPPNADSAEGGFNCNDVNPFQVIYADGQLYGFAFQHVGKLDGDKFVIV